MTRVYVDMAADLFHFGHVELLRRARELGDVLVVGIHSDETVARYKRSTVMTMEERVMASLARPRTYAVLLGGFAGFALVIAAVGLFSALSYSVASTNWPLPERLRS